MLQLEVDNLQALHRFLRVATPEAWLEKALDNLPLLLVDHAHCERKAAATAINFLSKYPRHEAIIKVMSPLAREELLHFEKVMDLLKQRNIRFISLSPAVYAQRLHQAVTKGGCLLRLCDELIVGAIIEARSCERFAALIPHLKDKPLAKFYSNLVRSEARHFETYLKLIDFYGEKIKEQVQQRLILLLNLENELICAKDNLFRFHSGV